MNKIYLDNAATTPIDSAVVDVMQQSMLNNFGNPSSSHQFGRKAKSLVETARKNIAKHFNISASELVFTAGGTEADNLILYNAVANLDVKTIITSKIEHHAVLYYVEFLEKEFHIDVVYVKVHTTGEVDYDDLAAILANTSNKALVSLMHINNEIGTILDIDKVSQICKNHLALFHSDTVQTIGHFELDLQTIPIDFITASAHKFHGPKGVGFAYFRKGFGIKPLFYGGGQEKGARASTENVHAILGMEKALEIAMNQLPKDREVMKALKLNFISKIQESIPNASFNGVSSCFTKSSYTILNVQLPVKNDLLLFHLDISGIAVSGGSACQSGSHKGSHVLSEILDQHELENTSIRFSFSKYNTVQEIETTVLALKKLVL